MGRIFLTSDQHFWHNKEFIWRPRGYSNMTEMNIQQILKWNKVVEWDDTVYLLGDVMLGDIDKGIRCLQQLNGKIFIIRGNHDTDNRVQTYVNISPNIQYLGYAAPLKYDGYTFFLTHYPTLVGNYDKDKALKKQVINICGHRHVTDPFYDWNESNIYHCEVDAHNGYPVLIDDIIKDINKKIKGE